MNLLLDTHIWLWSILEPRRIKPAVARLLENPKNELWLSSISVWEVLLLARKKRLTLQPDAEQWVRRWLRDRPLREAVLTREIAMESERLDAPHADPADRFLMATANAMDLVLVTTDKNILNVRGVRTLAN
jgi:PIN domain nuclease of toxin-antitoxin system